MAFPVKLFLCAASLLMVAACAGGPSSPPSPTGSSSESHAESASHSTSGLTIALSEAKRPLADVGGRVPGGKLLPPGTAKFLGLTGPDLQTVLGLPTFKRKDRQVEIWQYGKENCILDFFLYKKDGLFRVEHMDFRGRNVLKVDDEACLAHLLENKTG